MDANKLNPSTTDWQKTDVLLALDKQSGKVNVVKGMDEDGKLQTVPPTQNHNSDFMRVDKNSDLFSNFFSNFFRKLRETEDFDKPKIVYMEIQTDNPSTGYPFPCYSYDNGQSIVLNTG